MKNKIGIIIITRGKERLQFLSHAKWQIAQQSVKPDVVLIVDYEPESKEKDITQRYRRGFENLFNEEKCDAVICWEDDDFYKPDYIRTMVMLWERHNKPAMLGFSNSFYYNINDQKYFNVWHPGRASMMNTMVSKEIIKDEWTFPDSDQWTDYRLWTTVKNVKAIKSDKVHCIGIKHNIGMVGGNNHGSIYQNADKKHIIDDDGMKWLESQTDSKSIELYKSLSKTYKHPEKKEVDIVVPCNTLNNELQVMTEQFITNLKNSEKNINFNIYLLEQNNEVEYKGVKTIHYDFEFNYNKVMNYGYTFCKNQYVCFVNNDVVFGEGWATETIKQIEKHSVLSASPFNPFLLQKTGNEIREGYRVRKEMLGWCIMIDRKVFDIIGKFDESVMFWHSEVVYADQLKAANLKHILCENAVVNHYDKSRTLNLLPKDKYHEYTFKQSQNYEKKKERKDRKNKFGVAYNLFTGFELLEHSILSIYNSVDYICVVYSLLSHDGRPLKYLFMQELQRLVAEGIIDEIVEYKQDKRASAKGNETSQRQIGLEKCKENKCKYMMSMDVDELYIPQEFEDAKQRFIKGGYDSSACQMLSYYKYSNIILDPPETYYVATFYKINDTDRFSPKPFPVLVDNTRIYTTGKCLIFKRDELQMHHMSYVRSRIRSKLEFSCTPASEEKIKRIETHYKQWNQYIPNSHVLTYNGFSKFKTLENPPFNIQIPFKL